MELSHYLLFTLIIVCIITDLKSRRIYNLILIPFLIAGLSAAYLNNTWTGLLEGIKGFTAGLILLLIPFIKGGLGGGDVKLLAVTGSIMGPAFVFNTFIYGALAGGVMSVILLIFHRRFRCTLTLLLAKLTTKLFGYSPFMVDAVNHEQIKTLSIPYSLAIGAGAFISYYLTIGLAG